MLNPVFPDFLLNINCISWSQNRRAALDREAYQHWSFHRPWAITHSVRSLLPPLLYFCNLALFPVLTMTHPSWIDWSALCILWMLVLRFAFASVFSYSSLHTAIIPVVLLIFGAPALSRFSGIFSVLSLALLLMVSLKYTASITAIFWAGTVAFGILPIYWQMGL